jgi:DHA1 family tetracycline resistance protein-like MFS transporter
MGQRRVSGRPILTIFLTVFIDLLGLGIIIPILAPLLLDPGDMLQGMPSEDRNMIFGYLIATFSIFQFFFAPLLGSLSDHFGRKKVLFFSLFATLAGYLLFAYGISSRQLWLLFASRCLSGIAAGNLSVIFSAIADLSSPKEKAKNFGLVGMAFGLGFIIGPVLGGILSDAEIVSWFTFSTPFLFAGGLVVVNMLLVYFAFPETLRTPTEELRLSFFTGFRNIRKAFYNPDLRAIFIVIFLVNFGFTFFTQFFQPFLIERLSFDQSDIGFLFGFIGIVIAFTQGVLVRVTSRYVGPRKIVAVALLMLVGAFLLILWPETVLMLYLVIPGVAISQGLANPNLSAMVSNAVPSDLQGETLGIQQSVQSLAQLVPPIVGGYVLSIQVAFPIWLAAGATLLAWLAFILQFGFLKRKT